MNIEEILSGSWKDILAGETIAFTYDVIKEILIKYNRKLLSPKEDYINAYNFILKDILNWAGYIPSIGLYSTDNELSNHYVEMDYYLTPSKYQFNKSVPSKNLVNKLSSDTEKNLVLFGLPGMGKTTSMKMVSYKIITDEKFLSNYFPIPIVIRFREFKHKFNINEVKYNKNNLLFVYIFNLLNLRLSILDDKQEEMVKGIEKTDGYIKNIVISTLENLGTVIILDGFDELDNSIRDSIFSQVKELSFKTSKIKIILTSRTGEFKHNVENFHYYELAPLNNLQIKEFSRKWLGDKYESFISKLENSSFLDTAIRPLILSFLCIIYKHNNELPDKPKFLYKEIIDLLLERWDKERDILRKSKFSNFNKNQKLEFIADLAFYLSIESKYFFTKYDIQVAYSEISQNYGLSKFDYQEIIDEIEEYSGIFIQSGVDSYEFPHKSIQEFLAAEYLVKFNPLSKLVNKFLSIPNELAIVITLSRNPNYSFIEILNSILTRSNDEISLFLISFSNRLNTENPVFKSDYTFALDICDIIKKTYSKNKIGFGTFFLSLLKFKGVSESFNLLSDYYSCDPEVFHSLVRGKIYSKDDLIEISPKNSDTELTCLVYIGYISEWKYLSPYRNQLQ